MILLVLTPGVNILVLLLHDLFGRCPGCRGRVLCEPGCTEVGW